MASNSTYPYHLWLDGQWHEVNPSQYGKSVASLRATFHQWAKNNGWTLRTRSVRGDTLDVFFYREEN